MKISKIAWLMLPFFFSCSPTDKKLTNSIEGRLKKESVNIAPKMSGRIVKVFVQEGILAKAGDTLIQIDIPEAIAKGEQAQGALTSAKAQFEMANTGATKFEREQIEAKYQAALSQFKYADKMYQRLKNMYADSLIATQKLDETEDKYNAAKAQLDAVIAQKKDIEFGVRKEKREMAMGDMLRAEGALKEVGVALNERFIIAPKDMMIESINLREGELALAGYNLVSGYEMRSAYFRFTVKESLISNYKVNNIYTVELPFIGNKQVECRLISVKEMGSYAKKTSSFANYELGEAVYELKLILNEREKNDISSLPVNITALLLHSELKN